MDDGVNAVQHEYCADDKLRKARGADRAQEKPGAQGGERHAQEEGKQVSRVFPGGSARIGFG